MRLTRRTSTLAVAAICALAAVAFGVAKELDSSTAASSSPRAAPGRSSFAAAKASAFGTLPETMHLNVSTARSLGSFDVPDLGNVGLYRVRTNDGKQECLVNVGEPFNAASCVDGALFSRHKASFGIIGVGGNEAVPIRALVVGAVAPGIAHAYLVAVSGVKHEVRINAQGAFVYASAQHLTAQDMPKRLELRDSNNRPVETLVAGGR
jgi:hypothetical protein